MDSSLTLPVTLQDCCPLASATVVWGNWHIFLILWCGFGEGRHSRPQLYIQGNTQEVEIMPGYSKKKKIKPGLIFALWNDHCFLTLSMPPHFCFLYHSCLPSLMVAVFHKCNFMMKRWRECGCGWLPREAVTSAFLYLRDTLIKYQWDFFILNNLRERCICREIDIECQIYNIKLSYNNYIKNFILNLYTFKIYGTYFISMCSPRKTQQYVSENWKLILKKPIIFIPMGYFRKLIFSKDYRNFHKNILIWLRCSWITSLYWKLGLK